MIYWCRHFRFLLLTKAEQDFNGIAWLRTKIECLRTFSSGESRWVETLEFQRRLRRQPSSHENFWHKLSKCMCLMWREKKKHLHFLNTKRVERGISRVLLEGHHYPKPPSSCVKIVFFGSFEAKTQALTHRFCSNRAIRMSGGQRASGLQNEEIKIKIERKI